MVASYFFNYSNRRYQQTIILVLLLVIPLDLQWNHTLVIETIINNINLAGVGIYLHHEGPNQGKLSLLDLDLKYLKSPKLHTIDKSPTMTSIVTTPRKHLSQCGTSRDGVS